jgi:hemolysin III
MTSYSISIVPRTPRRTANIPTRSYSTDELANSLTHGVGLALSAVGCYPLLNLVAEHGLSLQTVGCGIFGVTLVAQYAASTTYHSAAPSPLKDSLQRLDHACIPVLIAGTWTSIVLGLLGGLGAGAFC